MSDARILASHHIVTADEGHCWSVSFCGKTLFRHKLEATCDAFSEALLDALGEYTTWLLNPENDEARQDIIDTLRENARRRG